jgi:formyltetrahydrofolate hydrolase
VCSTEVREWLCSSAGCVAQCSSLILPCSASAHRANYVTEVLDEGPIIEQDVARVSQNDQLPSLIQKGRDLERMVLSRAVQWHLDHRILSYANKTVIFA